MNSIKQNHPFYYAILRFCAGLVLIQAVRAAITILLWALLKPAPQASLWDGIIAVGIILTGLGLVLVFRPSIESLGLSLKGMVRGQKLAYLAGFILLFALVGTSSLADAGLLLANVVTVFIIPIFEELIFRGYGWNVLRKSDSNATDGSIWMWTSFLFGVWNIGYLDVFYLRAAPNFPLTALITLVLVKMVVGWIYGSIAGFVRLRTGKVYASIWVHGLGNLFGR